MEETNFHNENEPLLVNKVKEDRTENNTKSRKQDGRVVLYVIVVIFIGSIQMATMTLSQFVYHWLVVHSDNTTISSEQSHDNQTACQMNGSADENRFQKEASEWLWYVSLAEDGVALITVVVFGIFSDFLGRKFLFLVSISGQGLKLAIVSVVIYFELDIIYLVIAYLVGGLGGSYYTFHVGFLSSAADTTKTNNDRTFGVALLDLFLGFGVSATQIATGYLIELSGYLYPVLIGCGLTILSSVLAFAFVGETNKYKGSEKITVNKAFQNFTGFYRSKSYIKGNPVWKFVIIMIAFCLVITTNGSAENIETLFLLRSPLCFRSSDIGWFMSASNFTKLVIGISAIKLLHCCFKDESLAFLGLLSGCANYAVLSFSTETYMLYIAVAVGLLSILPFPMFRALSSKMVEEKLQGALFANVLVLEVIAKLASSTSYNNLYAYTQNDFAGLAFLTMAGTCLLAVFVTSPLVISGVKRDFQYSEDVG